MFESADLKVVTILTNKVGSLENKVAYDRQKNLIELDLSKRNLLQLPPEIFRLTHLRTLYLDHNQLTALPAEFGRLTSLQALKLNNNQLTALPVEFGQLTSLQTLYLDHNRLTALPAGFGRLVLLHTLDLNSNRLIQLPAEFGQLINLNILNLLDNPTLLTPPPEVTVRGKSGILDFLQELQKDGTIRYEVKLLVVGEGGTGKSSLLKSLRNEVFDPELPTTHGIELNQLCVPHPSLSSTEITLNTWDFGGQHIYHATHQFFLTKRSLYLVVWNARLGVEQGRLHFWLETIRALAPDAPILLVATHSDERAPDINYQSYQEEYPNLVGSYKMSNKSRSGLRELKEALARHAAEIRLVGQPWPRRWLEVEQQLLSRPEHHIDARDYIACCANNDVDAEIALGTLGNYLHDLGKVLYFRDDPVLSNLIKLKPNWVTKAISKVLTDEETKAARGILTHLALSRIWAKDEDGQRYETHLYPIFLRLMERFDLSYQIDSERPGKSSTQSLVPQLLPYQPPPGIPTWATNSIADQAYVEMRYRFDFVPAGTMPWFIVRTHPYTQSMHWQEGVFLKYQNHEAKVELKKQVLSLVVRGVQPYNFFTILMNTLDLILDRFDGLRVQRDVPCTCHLQRRIVEPCPRLYLYGDLVRRMEVGKHEIECPDSFERISVPQLLYGIHTSTNEQVVADIRRDQQQLLQEQRELQQNMTVLPKIQQLIAEMNQRSELIWRELIRQWNAEAQREEIECPNIFFLTLGKGNRFDPKNLVGQVYRLYLVCQHPPGPHQVGDGYNLREAKEWWLALTPWLNRLTTLFKVGVPLAHVIGNVMIEVDMDHVKNQIALVEQIAKDIPALSSLNTLDSAVPEPHLNYQHQVIGPALRALQSFLYKADPNRVWGGLHKTLTPDGNVLWLCEKHRQPYESKPLSLQYLK
jgi:internalin A